MDSEESLCRLLAVEARTAHYRFGLTHISILHASGDIGNLNHSLRSMNRRDLPRPVGVALSYSCPLQMSSTRSSGTTSNSVYSGHLTSKIRHESSRAFAIERSRGVPLFRRPHGHYFGVARFCKGKRKSALQHLPCCNSP